MQGKKKQGSYRDGNLSHFANAGEFDLFRKWYNLTLETSQNKADDVRELVHYIKSTVVAAGAAHNQLIALHFVGGEGKGRASGIRDMKQCDLES